jgi:hypothetical protein
MLSNLKSACYNLLVLFFFTAPSATAFNLPINENRSRGGIVQLNSANPRSPIDNRNDLLRGLLLPAACLASLTLTSKVASAKEDESYDPIVQSILDFGDVSIAPKAGDSFLVKVFDTAATDSAIVLAGAKLPFNEGMKSPFRFQLFKENLLIPTEKWNSLGDFDQHVVVSLCRGPIEKGGICKGQIIADGVGVSKVVSIGSESTEVRGIRLFSFVRLKGMTVN